MGIAEEKTRNNINAMFDFKTDCIEPEGMHGGWQTRRHGQGPPPLLLTSGTGYAEDGRERYFTPEELFFANLPLLYGGIKVRYPEYCGIYPRLRSRPSLHGKTKY